MQQELRRNISSQREILHIILNEEILGLKSKHEQPIKNSAKNKKKCPETIQW